MTKPHPKSKAGSRGPGRSSPSTSPPSRVDATESVFHGFSVAAVLQMLSLEHKSATVTIDSELGAGTVALVDGELVHATLGGLIGDAAALALLAAAQTRVAAREAAGPTLRTITTPLEHLVIEALRREDEGLVTSEGTANPLPQSAPPISENSADVEQVARVISAIDGVRTVVIADQQTGSLIHDTASNELVRGALLAECTSLATSLGEQPSTGETSERETLTSMGDVRVLTIWNAPRPGLTTSVVLNRRGQVQQIRRALHSEDR